MSKLWILLVVSLIAAWFIDQRDQDLLSRKGKQEHIITTLLAIILIFFCGLRVWGNDTVTYLQMYDQAPLFNDLLSNKSEISFSGGLGFHYAMSILKTLGFSSQNFLMFFSVITIIPYIVFIHKYSEKMTWGIFMMFVTGVYTFSMAAIKQSLATAFCLMAVDAAIEKKWWKYTLWMILAILSHPYAAIYLIVPFLFFKPLTKKTYILCVCMIVLGLCMGPLMNTILDVTSLMGANYTEESFSGAGVNIFRVLVCFAPIILGFLYGKELFIISKREDNVIFNITMMNALIMFVGLFGTANYFARLANYFLIGQVIILPWILERVNKKDKKWLKIACVVGYCLYFIFENAIKKSFDLEYAQITIWEYISSFF